MGQCSDSVLYGFLYSLMALKEDLTNSRTSLRSALVMHEVRMQPDAGLDGSYPARLFIVVHVKFCSLYASEEVGAPYQCGTQAHFAAASFLDDLAVCRSLAASQSNVTLCARILCGMYMQLVGKNVFRKQLHASMRAKHHPFLS